MHHQQLQANLHTTYLIIKETDSRWAKLIKKEAAFYYQIVVVVLADAVAVTLADAVAVAVADAVAVAVAVAAAAATHIQLLHDQIYLY